jgi:hypothetical protein
MSRKSANNSPFAIAQVKAEEFLKAEIQSRHFVKLTLKMRRGQLRTYGDLKQFIKDCEKEMELE